MSGTSTIARIVGTPGEVTIGAASAQSSTLATLSGGTTANAFRIVSTVACRILIGKNPTALATSALLPANVPEYPRAEPDEKIAVIQESAGGKLSVSAAWVE